MLFGFTLLCYYYCFLFLLSLSCLFPWLLLLFPVSHLFSFLPADIPLPSRMHAITTALQQHHALMNRIVKSEGTTVRISDTSRYSVNAMITWVGAWDIQMGLAPPVDGMFG